MPAADFIKSHEYHAFLSYKIEDVGPVRVVVHALERAGLRLYFAPEHLRGGLVLHEELALGIEDSDSFVLFVGPAGVGPYQQCEVHHASCLHRPIIKVVFRGAPTEGTGNLFDSRTLDCHDPSTEYELIDHLIEGITRMALLRVPLQFRSTEKTEILLPDLALRLDALSTINPGKRLLLNWVTFGHLIDDLRTQIEAVPGFRPSAYIGINASGLIIAQFLNDLREPIGYIHTKGQGGARDVVMEKSFFPDLTEGKSVRILLTDGEIKSGSSLEMAVGVLRKTYATAEIYYATLAAMVNPPGAGRRRKSLQAGQLIHKHLEDGLIKRIFIGGTFSQPGFFRPYDIR